MTIVVNNQPLEFAADDTIPFVLQHININTRGVAVAVNNEVVPKAAWETYVLKENDKLTIIRATQGG